MGLSSVIMGYVVDYGRIITNILCKNAEKCVQNRAGQTEMEWLVICDHFMRIEWAYKMGYTVEYSGDVLGGVSGCCSSLVD